MAIVFVDIFASCEYPIESCMDVALCMKSLWGARTVTNRLIVFGKVVKIGTAALSRQPSAAYNPICSPPTTPTLDCDPCTSPELTISTNCTKSCCTSCAEICVYQVQIDTEQFIIDPVTGTNYVPTCQDFLGIMPYSCVISNLFNASYNAPVSYLSTPTVEMLFSGYPDWELSANVILDPDSSNIITSTANGLFAEIPEEVWIDFTPTIDGFNAMTVSTTDIVMARYLENGKQCDLSMSLELTTGGTASYRIDIVPPIAPDLTIDDESKHVLNAFIKEDGALTETLAVAYIVDNSTPRISLQKNDGSDFSLEAGKRIYISGSYPIN